MKADTAAVDAAIGADGGAGPRAWAQILLEQLGAKSAAATAACLAANPDEHPALLAQRVGLHALIGARDASPQVCPVPLAACAQGAWQALTQLSGQLSAPGSLTEVEGAALLTERALLAGLSRAGTVAPGGGCRLLPTANGWLAVNLPREDDWVMLPAWLQAEVQPSWSALAAHLAQRANGDLIDRARLLGLAVAADRFSREACSWYRIATGAPITIAHLNAAGTAPRVLDLSSLWAGPLCGHLLQHCGAEVVKLESAGRPDGARRGTAAFYGLLNGGKASVVLDFDTRRGRERLRALAQRADIILESARPRGLRQLGIHAEDIIAGPRRPTWIAISGYGREPEHENHVAYGDDAAVAAGASRLMFEATGQHLLVGDAIADPLTGIHAALAAWASWRSGGGRLIALSLSDVVRACLQFDLPPDAAALHRRHMEWSRRVAASGLAPAARARRPLGPATPGIPGIDTAAVLARWGVQC